MSKRILMFCVVVLALAIAMPVFAAVQNVKVSGDLNVQGVSRSDFSLQRDVSPYIITAARSAEHQNVLLSTARLRVDAELTDNVSVVVRLLNERVWDQEYSEHSTFSGTTETATNTSYTRNPSTGIDIDLAYMTLKEFLYSPLTLTLGRQELHFGNDLIIGDVDTNGLASKASPLTTASGTISDLGDLSARKAFDAIRATLNYTLSDQPLAVDLIYAKIDENVNDRNDDVTLYGVNANYAVNNDLATEAYLWERDRQSGATGTGATGDPTAAASANRGDRLYTTGARAVYTGIENLSLQAEGAWQTGSRINSAALNPDRSTNRVLNSLLSVNAWALQLIGNYAFKDVRHAPALGVSFTHLSGEASNNSENYRVWDAMYENQGGGTIWNKILGFSNCDLTNVNLTLKPDYVDDLTVALNWYHILLSKSLALDTDDSVTLSGVAGGQTYKVTSDKHLGDEIDLGLTYDYTEDVQLGLNLGLFLPGDTFRKDNSNNAAQAIASMKVTF